MYISEDDCENVQKLLKLCNFDPQLKLEGMNLGEPNFHQSIFLQDGTKLGAPLLDTKI